MNINTEKSPTVHIVATGSAPIEIPRSDGWYLIPIKHDENGKALDAVWHFGRRWEAPDHPKVPYVLRGVQTVIEYCQGSNAVLTGGGLGTLDWHGPFPEPNPVDWLGAETCPTCKEILTAQKELA